MQQFNSGKPRRPRAYVNTLGIIQLHLRNPLVIAFWSVMFPGFGHMLLNKYIRGFVLFIWEVFINLESHINLAILYSFTGQFELAKEVLNKEWLLIYLPTYMFTIWDSYRSAVTVNSLYKLSAREDAPISPLIMNSMGLNYLDKRNPRISIVWSLLMPGVSQLYLHRIISAFFIMLWWIATVYFSKLLPCFHYTLLGDFANAKAVVNPHWFLNIPSIYMFAMYDSYIYTVEYNNLYDWEQANFLKNHYQNRDFTIQAIKHGGEKMHIFSTFDHSNYLELAITAIEMKGIPKENILAVPMDKRNEERKLFDTLHYSDGVSSIDIPMILGTFFMIFGSVYGFVLTWGPLIWGLIGLTMGLVLGLIIKLIVMKKASNKPDGKRQPEVILVIECSESQADMIKDTLWANHAIGVRKLELS